MLTVEDRPESVERRLAAGELACPVAGCGGVLAPWGFARQRMVLGAGLVARTLRPRRSRCRKCRVSHVLLTVFALARRAYAAEVVGAALAGAAAGKGSAKVAGELGVPRSTVRRWTACLAGRAGRVREFFTVLMARTGPDPVMPAGAGPGLADAVAAIAGAAAAVAERWPQLGEVPVWQAASAASGGLLIAPGWPPGDCNTK